MVNCATIIIISVLFGFISGRGIPIEDSAPPLRVQQCREGCLEKFSTENIGCLQRPECAVMDFSPNLNNYISEALRFLCWEQCMNPPPPKTHKLIPGAWSLHVVSMTRQGPLVSADVAWEPAITNSPSQCLVTWEVSGGGLMGNLLTDSSTVQLSLWPDTIYRIQVTCKNKDNGSMTRSLPLTLNTNEAVVVVRLPKVETEPATTEHREEIFSSSDRQKILNDYNSDIDEVDDLDILPEDIDILGKNSKHIPQVIHSEIYSTANLGVWKMNETRRQVIMAVCAAFMLMAVVLAAFLFARRRVVYSSDKEVLIEHEVVADTRTLHV